MGTEDWTKVDLELLVPLLAAASLPAIQVLSHCTALLAQVESPRLFPACESVHPCELPVPCPVPLPPGAPGPCTGTYRQGHGACIQGRADTGDWVSPSRSRQGPTVGHCPRTR